MLQHEKNYYEFLEINRDASEQEIRNAYIKIAKKIHPDSNSGSSNGAMSELNHIYEVLSDPQKKRLYDIRFSQTEGFDFTRPVRSTGPFQNKKQTKDLPQREQSYSVNKKSWTKKLRTGLEIILIIIMCYLFFYLLTEILAFYMTLPGWVKTIFPI
jgi:DnaJ-class molecular chaperone